MSAMARSLAELALSGYSPPTPNPKINKQPLIVGNSIVGEFARKTLDKNNNIDPPDMNAAVSMLPFRRPMVLESNPNAIMPTMTPNTTEYVIDW